VFGGFTPVEWESRKWNGKSWDENNCYKGEDSMRSFLFTLRNPHGVPPRKFALKKQKREFAIRCDSECGSQFCTVIDVNDNCTKNRESFTWTGTRYGNDGSYVNDTAFEDFLTGLEEFSVNESEVFKIK
jgi:hypothetical protein